MDIDDKKRVKSLLFSHGSSQLDYAAFGDVVTFDTTYRTNLYNLPFGLFVGVNNHFQSVIFAGVLLTEETIEAFKWTFRNFTAMMGRDAPKTILTGKIRLYKFHCLASCYISVAIFSSGKIFYFSSTKVSFAYMIELFKLQISVTRCVLQSRLSSLTHATDGANGTYCGRQKSRLVQHTAKTPHLNENCTIYSIKLSM
jgi:hypothetical protein